MFGGVGYRAEQRHGGSRLRGEVVHAEVGAVYAEVIGGLSEVERLFEGVRAC